jgi:hypothetical protein
MSIEGQASMFKNQRLGRALVARIAAVVVVALLGGVLYAAHSAQGTRVAGGGGPGNKTVVVPTSTVLPQGNYSATPGPLANYIAELYTTGNYPSDGVPVTVKSHFVMGDWVYVVTKVHGLPNGTHTISIKCYEDGTSTEVPLSIPTSQIASDQRVVFSLRMAVPFSNIAYMARIYIDRPASDAGDSPSDPYLAGTVVFVVEMP